METTKLIPLIEDFLSKKDQDAELIRHNKEHSDRCQKAQELFQVDKLNSITKDELESFLMNTDAWYGIRGRDLFRTRLFGEDNEKLPNLREKLITLIQQAEMGLTASQISSTLDNLHGVGLALLSEILALRFPEKYCVVNSPVREFVANQGVDVKEELPWGEKGNPGKEYLLYRDHLSDLRHTIADQLNEPVDFLLTDLFIYWAKQQEVPEDLLHEKIAEWAKEFEQKRIDVRKQGEESARLLLESKLGEFNQDDLRKFAEHLNSDWIKEKLYYTRFKPVFCGPQLNMLLKSIDEFNEWAARIWKASDEELDDVLKELWDTSAVYGGGITFPTAILYIKDPEKYNIWLIIARKALQKVTGFDPGNYRTVEGYRRYNQELNEFRARYQLSPQILDNILWRIASQSEDIETKSEFTGFVEDTFKFLSELEENNSVEWMHGDDKKNLKRYRNVLREPLRSLFNSVANFINDLDPSFETDVKTNKVLASINKRFEDDEGPYHPYYWGAFYRKGHKKQTDCQFFINVHPDHVNVGYCVAGSRGSELLEKFHKNITDFPAVFMELMGNLPDDIVLTADEKHGQGEKQIIKISDENDLNQLSEYELINIEKKFDRTNPILYTPEFSETVEDVFQSIYPIFRFSTGDEDVIDELISEKSDEDELVDEEIFDIDNLIESTYLPEEFWRKIGYLLEDKGQIVLYGPPGTGKTWIAHKLAKYWVDLAPNKGGEVKTIQFHPSYSYEDFMEGIRPVSIDGPNETKQVSYPIKPGIFRRLCEKASLHPKRRYALVIDEINRGELPRIFGELLYLLEYRQESVELSYSGNEGEFGIPKNVYIIGTMNTADRSIALVDHALRRRFYFVPLRPTPEILRDFLLTYQPEMEWVADLLGVLNTKLEVEENIDWTLHIGHSHFMKKNLNDATLRMIWDYSVMPTLEEYFYRKDDEHLKSFGLNELKAALGKI